MKMLKRTITLILGLLVGMFIIREGTAQKLEKSLLWEIQGNGIQTSYLYGTFHLLPQSDFQLKPNVLKAFEASAHIVMELDMDTPGLQMEMMKYAAMKDGQTLDQLMSARDYQLLDSLLKASLAGVSLDLMKSVKPFFVGSMLLPSLIDGHPASYEMSFVQLAIDQKKEVLGLESVKDQVAVFDHVSYEAQVEGLLEMVHDRPKLEKLFNDMIQLYKEEDAHQLNELILKYMDSEAEQKYLLADRNKNWVPKMRTFAADKATFFAVGAGHLAGEKGLIALLRKEGYEVRAVK